MHSNPTDCNVYDGSRAFRDSGADAVVALGGGSAIDVAKAIAVLATNPEPIRQYMGYHRVPRAGAPLIAVPTTAGTGSEVTRVAVIADTKHHEKMMLLIGALFHVPHGLSNAVLLPAVTRFSIPGAPTRYATISRIMGFAQASDDDTTAADKLPDGLEALNEVLEIPSLRDCVKVGRAKFNAGLKKMAHDALDSGSPQNNPIVPAIEQIIEPYRQAW